MISIPAGCLPHREFSLRANSPVPGSVTESWLHFSGVTLFEAEEVWNDSGTAGTWLDGEILNRVAIYGVIRAKVRRQLRWIYQKTTQPTPEAFVGEVARYNPRVFFALPGRPWGGPNRIPFFARAGQFLSLRLAIESILKEPLIAEGSLLKRLDEWTQACSMTNNRCGES